MDWTSWNGLEHWYYFNHIGHYFNTSPQLPNAVYRISIIINLFQCIPILSSVMILVPEQANQIAQGLKVLFKVFIYLYFIPPKYFATTNLIIMLAITIFFLFSSHMRSGRLLQNDVALCLRLFAEIFTPILFVWSGATTHQLVRSYYNDKGDLPFLIISVIASIGYFVNYLIITYFESRTLFLKSHLFATWNSSYHCFLIVGSVILLQTWILVDIYPGIGRYISISLAIFFNLLLFIATLSLPYIQSKINTMSTVFIIFLAFLNVLFLFELTYPQVNSIIYFGIGIILLLLSALIGPSLTNKMSHIFLDISLNGDEDSSDLEDIQNEIILDQINKNNSNNKNNNNNGNNKPNDDDLILKEQFKRSKFDTYKLRQLFITDRRRSERFATFLLNTSTKMDDIMESFRILTILHKPPVQRIIEYNLSKLDTQQLLCDLQYEAIARDLSDESINEVLNHLEAKTLVIKRNLSAIADSIQLTNKEDTFSFIQNYAKECSEYEMMASFMLVHAPYSTVITQHLVTYFNNLRGDMEQGQTWLQNTDGLRKSSSFSGYRSRLSVNVSSTRINELGGIQRLNSQRALQKIHSNALRGSAVFFCFTLIISLFCSFYKYNPQTVEYITSEVVSKATVQLSTFSIAPLFSLFELMSNVLSDCSPSNAKKFENLFNHAVIPFNSGVNQIVTALELLSQAIRIVDNNMETPLNAYYTFSSIPMTKDNISLQLLMNQIHKISEVAPKGKCSFKYLQLVNEFSTKINIVFEPLKILKSNMFDFSDVSINRYERNYVRDYCILIVIMFVFLFIAFFYIQFITDRERKKFWTEFSELDGSDLEKFQKQLIVHGKIDTTQIVEDPNLLSPDEIEAPETERLILTNELLPLGKLKKRFNFFPIYTIVFLVAFGALMFVHRIPVRYALDIDLNLGEVSHFLQTLITQHTSKIIDYTYKALFTAIPISSSLLEDTGDNTTNHGSSSDIYDFYDFGPLLQKYNSFFKDASNFQEQLKNVTAESLKHGENWGIFQLDDSFFEMVWLAFHNVTGLSNQISEWYFDKHAQLDEMRTFMSHTISSVLCVILALYTIVVVHQLKMYNLEFDSLKALIIILPSPYFGSTANIIESFKPHSTKKVGPKRFRSRYIIKHSVNSIIVIDSNRLIQDVNKATIELFGYKRDALIRTDLMTLFSQNDHQSDDFSAQLSFLNRQNAQNLPLREFNLSAKPADQSEPIPVNCTLIPIGGSESTDSPAFAVLLRDRSEFLKQDILYRNMQHQVESLLLRIMPKVMVMKLLAKNQILHSQVNHATFIFIGIVNFLEWCKMHTHTEIMDLLDVIVSAFDKKISKYLSLVKIKIINGVYMAAGGLFEEVSEKPHEVEMVEFAIKCVKWIKNRNILTSSNLQLQIGIHTGGPIIAGILGHDKPFFDVYGDAVNVAARLETSAEPGRIQISQEMKKALPKGMFQLQKRLHVFLKGKGDATTYEIIIPEETKEKHNI